MTVELYNKIDKFCNETDWSKYLTYEHALEEFIKEIVEEETKELKEENKVLAQNLEDTEILNKTYGKRFSDLEKENAELRKVAEFQQSSNMDTHLKNKKLKEGLAVGSMWNKHLNSQNKALEEDRDKYRNMVFDQREHLTKAKEIIKKFSEFVNNKVEYDPEHPQEHTDLWNELCEQAEQFLNGEVSE